MIKKRCKDCGVPLAYGRRIIWTSGGTIAVEKAPELRLFFIEIDELLNLLSNLSEMVLVPFDDILIDSERPIGSKLVESIFSPALFRLTRSTPTWMHRGPLVNSVFSRIANYARVMGYGSTTLLEYEGARRILIRVRNTHSLPLIVGDVAGILNVLLGVNMGIVWKKENGTTLLEFRQADEEPGGVTLTGSEFKPGQVQQKPCRYCGAPLAISEMFEFDTLNGIISNRRTSYREAFMSVQGINTVLEQLKRELGEELPVKLARRQAELMRERMSMRNLAEEGGIDAFLEELRVRGMGNPVGMKEGPGGRLELKVENPFNDALMAGRIAGYYEAANNVESVVAWSSGEEGCVEITVEPG